MILAIGNTALQVATELREFRTLSVRRRGHGAWPTCDHVYMVPVG
jgi:hypothetical protein